MPDLLDSTPTENHQNGAKLNGSANGFSTNGHSDQHNPNQPGLKAAQLAENEHTREESSYEIGKIKVIKRDGKIVDYDDSKINLALTKAFLDVRGTGEAWSAEARELIQSLTAEISEVIRKRILLSGGNINIEEIQDQVELALMRLTVKSDAYDGDDYHDVLRSYINYRDTRAKLRQHQQKQEVREKAVPNKAKSNETPEQALRQKTHQLLECACEGLAVTAVDKLAQEAEKQFYRDMNERDLIDALILAARPFIEQDPDYSFVTARLLLNKIHADVGEILDLPTLKDPSQRDTCYAQAFIKAIEKGIEWEHFSDKLNGFDLERLSKALMVERDLQFNYIGLQSLYDRYLLSHEKTCFELPQVFLMRVSMGLAIEEVPHERDERAIEFYELLSAFDYMCSTPTLFNSGTRHSQLSSCYLTTVPDNLDGIFNALHDNAMLSKWAGGLGNDWTPVRATGAHIKGTNGKSQGVVPFMKVADTTAVAVNQGGKRKGAVCAYLETWHLDIEQFLELRKNTGDDRRRTHDMNTANWIPDLFMERVFEDAEWTLFSPNETPDLHDLYGKAFRTRYEEYERLADQGEIKFFKRVKATTLWKRMLSMLFETGHPWITFKDACNLRSPQQHAGVVHSSNLCTEITLNTSADEVAVCNLGSLNLANHVDAEGNLDLKKLERTTTIAMRMLDNVIDINYYAVSEAKASNLKHRPVGLGVMGFQDALYKKRVPYASEEAVEFADRSMEAISYFAIKASTDLAKERGAYQTFDGSLWSQGVLPIDSLRILKEQRGKSDFFQVNESSSMDWSSLRELVKTQGMRNSNVLAIAPTATIANILGVTPSIEPTFQNLFTKSNLSGEFVNLNSYLVHDLKKLDIWDSVMVDNLKQDGGSLAKIDRVPEHLKILYATAFEVGPRWLVESASRRQKWIDQSQSLNLYVAESSGRKLDVTYRMAWLRGLKCTYYLRTESATTTEQSTVKNSSLNAVASTLPPEEQAQTCAISGDPEECEACQ